MDPHPNQDGQPQLRLLELGNGGEPPLVRAQRVDTPEAIRKRALAGCLSIERVGLTRTELTHGPQAGAVGLHSGLVLLGSAATLSGVRGHQARDAARVNLDRDNAAGPMILAAATALARRARGIRATGVTSAALGVKHETGLAAHAPHELEVAVAEAADLEPSAPLGDLSLELALDSEDMTAGAATVEVASHVTFDGRGWQVFTGLP